MLKPEQAKARLEQWILPEGKGRLTADVGRLPAELEELALDAFDLRPPLRRHDPGWSEQWKTTFLAAERLDQLPADDRRTVFSAISPHLAPAIEQTWQRLKSVPYQTGYNRRAFRAPNHPQLTLQRRIHWLHAIVALADRFPADVLSSAWLAAWTPHITIRYSNYGHSVGLLLASVIEDKSPAGAEVFEILRASLNSQHEIGAPGRHIYNAFLLADRPDAWEIMEKAMLASQRQEGLRQAILEAVDESHPTAFRRMTRVILEHDLVRFSAVVRAFDVWLGHNWSAASAGIVKKMLARLVEFWDDAAPRTAALRGKDGTDAFLALWCDALDDAPATVPRAAQLLAHKSIDMRYAAIHHLGNLQIPDAGFALAAALDDENIAVSILAVIHGYHYFASDWSMRHARIDASQAAGADDRFERLERLLGRTTKSPKKVVSPLWPCIEFKFDRDHIGRLLVTTRGNRPMSRLVPHLTILGPSFRQVATGAIVAAEPWDAEIRHVIVDLAGDSATQVRATALESLKKISLTEPEAIRLESYLTRKTSDLRQKVLTLLITQADEPALASARRMTAANDANQRLAGLEMLRVLHDAGRRPVECREIAAGFRRGRKKFSKDEELHLKELEKERQANHSLGDALGLIDPAGRSPAVAPRVRDVPLITPAAIACLTGLDDLVHEHRETPIAIKLHHGEERQELLGNIRFGFPRPDREKPAPGQESELPLADIWRQWHRQRGPECRDVDGLELVRARAWLLAFQRWRFDPCDESATQFPERVAMVAKLLGGMPPPKLRYGIIDDLLNWLLFLFPVDAREYLLDATESSYALVPEAAMKRLTEVKPPERPGYGWMGHSDHDWRNANVFQLWSNELARHIQLEGRDLSNEQMQRWWQLMHWLEEPFPGAPRKRIEQAVLLWAYAQGHGTLADVGDHLLGPRAQGGYRDESFDLVASVTDRNWQSKNASFLTERPELREFFERAVARILDLELARGDAPTLATRPALAITNLFGFATLHRILKTLGRGDFKLASWHGEARLERRATLTHLAKHCYPAPDESPELLAEHFTAAIEAVDFPEERLLQLCFLAPQWAKAIEAFYGWDGLCEGIYWFLAHMKYAFGLGDQIGFDEAEEQADPSATPAGDATPNGANEPAAPAPQKLSAWERLLRERTALTDAERSEGAVDIDWFHRTYAVLGKKHWERLAAAARFAATPAQAKHARFIGDVLLGRVKRSVLTTGIEKKQLKEHVRMLGLLPLAKGNSREADLMLRAKVLRDYRRYANQLSGLTKPDALRSWEIGMKNLAQAAGFPDPLRLEWAVGAESVKDLVKGPVSVSAGGVEVTLSLDHLAVPEVAVQKAGKPLKSIPPGAKKDKKIAALTGRVADIKRQASGIRQSLEAAMCRGDTFTGTELRSWFAHALLAPLLKRLVVVGEGVLGYPDKGGKTLRDHGGKPEPVKPGETLRIAHPFDLLQTREWHLWQRDCFTAERIQPFKQVFRELYVPNKQEKSATVSQRYDGQQIQPKQALALFNSRGWDTRDGIAKVYHHAAVSAIIGFQRGVTTPAEVEDPCFAGIVFMRHGERELLKTADVPPRIFSETMRDLDLVVSVAHAGGVDPEASASTVEMRTGLLRETCSLLRLKNVRLNSSHAVIEGELAQYSVHLGSGSVHKMPGGALCIVPVHAQQRGRIFLPFADDDPRTAEIVSKVLLLARDREIQDPVILEQIRL